MCLFVADILNLSSAYFVKYQSKYVEAAVKNASKIHRCSSEGLPTNVLTNGRRKNMRQKM
jgi:hypothetical protein